jgi:Ca2+-binding RTX toxin-like protein
MSMSELGTGITNGGVTWDPLAEITHDTVVQGCDCPICKGLREEALHGKTKDHVATDGITDANPEGNPLGVLLNLVTNPDGSRSFTGNRNVDATLIGSKWGTQELTYSFPTLGSNYNGSTPLNDGVDRYHLDLGTLQQQAARAAFAQISAATNMKFTEITETDTTHANIRISQTADNDVGSAYGGFPSDKQSAAGDIWFGRTNQPYYDLASKGTWGYATMLHEIGHTMGLKHGHQDYTNSDLSFYFGTSPRFGSQSLTPDRDGQSWSLMTYTPAPGTGGFAGEKINQPQTYMQYDLAALQYLYGANYTTNATDSVYTFSQTTGEMFINGIGQGAPSGNKIFATIWDGGGNDTIDASNYANGVSIDLRPGEFSTVDQAQLANNTAYQNFTTLAPGNIAMSLLYNNDARSLIENAKGGAGNDVFVGNTANNVLDGGAGSDTVVFTGTTGINVTLNDTGADVLVTHDGETDTLRSIENIQGTVGNDTLVGNSQNNSLSGGASGADTLSGGAGDDRLIGGGFTTTTTVSAPSQADITKPQATNNGSIATAVATAGAFDVDANPDITNATTLPHATINATAAGGSLEYYRIDVTVPGSQAIFDIDGPGTLDDSFIELVNAAGVVIASNDTGAGDPSYPGHDDAYLAYTFATAGTYYIRVGLWNGAATAQPLIAGQTYQLNVSLANAAVVTTTTTATNNSSLVADGGEGNDFIAGTLGNDVLNGGSGNDTASFVNAFNAGTTTGVTVDLNIQGVAQDTVAAGRDTLTGIENLVGSALNDTLIGNADANVIEGGLGDDTLVGGAGDDTASYAGAAAGVTVSLALQGTAQNTGAAGTDTLTGFQNLLGSAFNDTLTGDAGENVLTGGAGNDTLRTGGNTAGTVDLLDGGAGSDTASFSDYSAGITAILRGANDGVAVLAGGAIASLRGIENLRGSEASDTLFGDDNANVIEGGLGDDMMVGGNGNDTVAFSGSTGVTVDLSNTGAQNTGVGNDTILGFENVRTGSGDDTVTGDAGDNIFFDGGGADSYNGGAGSDTVDYSAATIGATVNLNLTTAQTGGAAAGDTITNIENIIGSATASNSLTGGNGTDNRLVGGALADFIIGGGANDTLIGGAGNDVLFGDYVNTFNTTAGVADGNDVLEGGAGSDILVGGLGNDILRGGDGDDTLVGGIANATINGLTAVYTNDGGNDTFDGGDGTDTAYAYYTGRAGGISFDLGNLSGDSAITLDGADIGSFTSVERVIFRGGTGNDVVRGGGTLDTLVGNEGDDILDGWYGNDTLSGGLGNDTLIGGEGLDTATYVNATAGVNVDLRIQGTAQDTGGEGVDTLSGIEYLTGSAFGDTLRGNDEFNLIIDNAVSSTATAGQTDALYGYDGDDSLLVTRASGTVATNVIMDGGDGNDIIELRSGALTAAPVAVADGLSTATYLSVGATGDRNADTVTVDAGAGNDRIILTGVASATVNAGSGNDTLSISMRGGAGVNNYQLTLGAGADVVQLAGTGAETTTTARGSRITDFDRGNTGDRFEMTAFLNGGLTGYTANSNAFASGHLRLVQSGTDLLLQSDRDGAGTANDFVTLFAISNGYTGGFTAFNFDGAIGNLTLTGFDGNETITGATGNDVLSGGGGDDMLYGLAGNDRLDGGSGNDLLDGGLGDDILATITGSAAIKTGGGFDRVDGGLGNDTLNLGGFETDYQVLVQGDRTFLVTSRSATEVTGVEQATFFNTAPQAWSNVLADTKSFDGLSYIAGYSDLRAAFGGDAAAGAQHFALYGFAEGRTASFNALDYIASYSDLRAAFGADAAAGARHYILYGANENRAVTFDGWSYLASYGDLIRAFGPNEAAAAQHFINYGANENRTITFDAAAYAAANPDLAAAYGTDKEALARHYVAYGYAEGRSLGVSSSSQGAAAAPGADHDLAAPAAAPAAAQLSIAAAFVDHTAGSGDANIGDALLFGSMRHGDLNDAIHNQHIVIA